MHDDDRGQRSTPDLDVVRSRCELKAAACRWGVERAQLEAEGASFQEHISPRDQEFLDKARQLPECYMWMLDPYGPDAGGERLADMAGVYANLVEAIDLIRDAIDDGDRELVTDATRLFAEGQSAVRAGALRVGLRYERDQQDAFDWLRDHTYREQIYVPRYMRLNDPADPEGWEDLQERLEEVRGRLEGDREANRSMRELMGRADFLARKLAEDPEHAEGADWERLFDAITRLVTEEGLSADDSSLRELLIPILDEVPEDMELSEAAERVLDEVEGYLDQHESETSAEGIENR